MAELYARTWEGVKGKVGRLVGRPKPSALGIGGVPRLSGDAGNPAVAVSGTVGPPRAAARYAALRAEARLRRSWPKPGIGVVTPSTRSVAQMLA